MSDDRMLPSEQVFEVDGHLTELGLTALSDGELELLPPSAVDHVNGCDRCSARLGELGLFALSLDDALGEARVTLEAPVPAAAAQPLPAGAIVLGLVIAALGAVPRLLELPEWLLSLPASVTRTIPVALRVSASLLEHASTSRPSLLAVFGAACIALAALALILIRLAPREVALKGVEK